VQAFNGQFFMPAKNAVIPQLVSEKDLVRANSLNAVSDSLTRLIGPSLGGVMYAALGLGSVVIADAISFFLSALLIALIVMPRSGETTARPARGVREELTAFWGEWLNGLRLVRFDRMLGPLFIVLAIFSLADSMLTTLLVAFVNDIMHGGSEQLGWLLATQGVGGLIGGLVLAKSGARIPPARLIAAACLIDGCLLLIIFNVPIFQLALGIIFLAGIVMVGAIVSITALLQSGASDEYRGRVFGAFATTQSLMRLVGIVVAGSAAQVVGIIPVLNTSGAMWLLAGALCLMLMPVTHGPQTDDGGRPRMSVKGAVREVGGH
jgi:MFS family permease